MTSNDPGCAAILHSHEYLLNFQHVDSPAPSLDVDLSDVTQNFKPKRKTKRGSRGGVRNRLKKRGCRLPLPAITLSNVRSLQNQMDELSALTKYDGDYRRCSLICFTETWLTKDVSDLNLPGYTAIRLDHDSTKTQKQLGGGLGMLVNNKWATNFTVRETVNSKHYEILTVSFRPHYLPREFGQITVILVYVPGPDFTLAAERISESNNKAVSRSPDQPVFVLGDFNRCEISDQLPTLHQYVSCPTRMDKTPDSYVSRCRPPLGRSDYSVVHLLPKYRQKLKEEPPQVQPIKHWTPDSAETLRGCFEATDWNVFFDSGECDQDALTDTITSYIIFCEDSIIPTKEVRIYPNNKPWIGQDWKQCLNEKKLHFCRG